MPLNPLNHYSIENPASVYDEEAMTALELAGRTTAKVNETVRAFNELETQTNNHLESQDNAIIKMNDVTMPARVRTEVQHHIDNGTFTQQIDESLQNLNQRVDNLLTSIPEGGTTMDAELLDIRVGHDEYTYANAGNAVRSQLRAMGNAVSQNGTTKIKFSNMVAGEYYQSGTGAILKSDEWKRSLDVMPCAENVMLVPDSVKSSDYMIINYFDKNMTFLGMSYGINSNADGYRWPTVTPTGTAFIGLCGHVEMADEVTFTVLDMTGVNFIQYPYDGRDKNYLFIDGHWYNSDNGSWTSAPTVFSIIFPCVGMRYIYSNNGQAYKSNAVFYDGNNVLIQNSADYEDIAPRGRLYRVPANAKHVCMHGLKSAYVNEDTEHYSEYISIIRDAEPGTLMGKHILCVGDSLTWLDGQYNIPTGNPMTGWQAEMRAKGAIVNTLGCNGDTYARYSERETSIWDAIVTNNYDLTPYDAVLYFGGTNDCMHDIPIGVAGSIGDATTMCGALSSLINWVHAKNPTCQVFLVTPLGGKASNVSRLKMRAYRDGVMDCGVAYGVPVIDLYGTANITATNYDTFSYDGLHPNYTGMRRIGQIIAKQVENHIV